MAFKNVLKYLFIFVLCAGFGFYFHHFLTKEIYTRNAPEDYSRLVEMAAPSVVNIRTLKKQKKGGKIAKFYSGEGQSKQDRPVKNKTSLGTGFILNREGYIVTNSHVVKNAVQIQVKLYDNAEYKAEIIGRDQLTDIALLKINAPPQFLLPLKFGDSHKLKVGNKVIAIGSPFGLKQTVTAGIVSAMGRVIGSGPYDDYIQTDASINPGNSGGPLINMAGEVVGINKGYMKSGHGIGFVIPIHLAQVVIAKLKKTGRVERGFIGIQIKDITPEQELNEGHEKHAGVLIANVIKGSPADKGGITLGDILVSLNDKPIKKISDVSKIFSDLEPGQKIILDLIRQGKKISAVVKTCLRPGAQ